MSSDLDNRSTLEDFGLTSLPAEWRVPVVGDLLGEDRGISVGVMYPGEHCDQGVPLVKAGDLKSNWINPTPPFRITPDKHYEYRRTELEGGELLVSLVGNTGQTAVVPPHMKGWNVARAVAVVRLGRDADPHYVKYALQLPAIGHLMKSWCNTTVQETLNLKEIKRIPIPVPEKTEQKAIAHILGTLDDKIELNRKTNETLEAMAKALFQSWFVDFDPVRAKAEGRPTGLPDEISDLFPDSFEESELGEIPRGWRVAPVGDVVECVGGSTPSTIEPDYWEGGEHYWATPKDLSSLSEPFLLDTAKKITAAGVQRISSGVLPAGTVLLSSRAPVGYIAVACVPISINQGFIALKASADMPTAYLLNWCIENIQQFKDRATGTTFPEISKAAFRPIPLLIPEAPAIQAFARKTQAIYEAIVANMKEVELLANSRDTLLPKLISGELRIPEAEKLVSKLG